MGKNHSVVSFETKKITEKYTMVHEGIKPYQCPKCYEGFTQTGNLKPHIKTIHEGKKPFECEFGDFKFAQKI